MFRERQRHADQRQALDEQVAERERQRCVPPFAGRNSSCWLN